MILSKILLLLSFINPSDSVDYSETAPVQQVISSEVVIKDSLFTEKIVSLNFGELKGWKFSPQDNPEFSSPDYDDSHWYKLERSPNKTIKLPDTLWQGFGWLRLRIRIDSSFTKKLNLIYPGFMGATELYINDSLVMRHGIPGVTQGEQKLLGTVIDVSQHYDFLPGETYQFSIKYSLHNLSVIRRLSLGTIKTPFIISFALTNYDSFGLYIENSIILTSILILAATVLLLVMLLHLFMYLSVSEKKANFAIMVLSTCLFLLSLTALAQFFSIRNFWICFILIYSSTYILALICASLVPWVTYQVLDVPAPLFWKRFVFVPLFLLLVHSLFSDFATKSPNLIVRGLFDLLLSLTFIPAVIGSILAIVKARKMKKGGIGIIAGSLLVYPIGFIILMVLQAIVTANYFWGYISFIILFIMLISVPVGMSIQQAKKFLQLHLHLDFLVKERTSELSKSLNDLKSTQSQLIHSEKLASLGALTAGIAHEIQNPLNFVNNFSEVNKELIEELKEELIEGSRQYAVGSMQSGEEKLKLAEEIANDIKKNEEKINHHGKRAESIVKGMLLHSRGNSGQKEPTDINALCDEYLRLSYHGFRAKDKAFNAEYKTDFDPNLPKINVVPQDIGRVLLNLINNAFYAVSSASVKTHGSASPHALSQSAPDNPSVIVATKNLGNKIEISVKDNGPGIPADIVDKIFQPFFTTKPTGQGTGLGLSLAYDIVKAHGGEIKVETKEAEGTEFIIYLPLN